MSSKLRLHIFHPSDFSKESSIAFHHAVKMVLLSKGALDILHVIDGKPHSSAGHPQVRRLLARWKELPENSNKSAVANLHIHVRKIIKRKPDPVEACLDYLEKHPVDLIVLMIHQKNNGWIRKRVGPPIARKSHQITLFLPENSPGFVAAADGALSLRHVLIPIAPEPSAAQGIADLLRLQEALRIEQLKVTFLYVGNEADAPELEGLDNTASLDTDTLVKSGNPAEQIVATASELEIDMVLMVTEGRHGFLDALRGSVSEQVLKDIHCPLLSIPAKAAYN